MSRIDPRMGAGFFLEQQLEEALTEQGAGTTTSSFTQAGPEPGLPEPDDSQSRFRPAIVGAQENALSTYTVRGGFPGIRGGAGILYRLATDAQVVDYRGWSPPNLVTGWSSPPSSWADANSWTRLAITADPETGIIVAIGQFVTGTDAMTWSYDPRTNTWTDAYDWAANQGLTAVHTPFLMPDPDVPGRILLIAGEIGYYSDDLGQNWVPRSRDANPNNQSVSIAAAPGLDWLGVGIADDIIYATSDRGASWDELEDTGAATSGGTCRALYADGSYLVFYVRPGDSAPAVRRLTHARASFADAEEIVIDDDAARDATTLIPVLDDDGTIYVYTRDLAAADVVRLYASRDGGRTWSRFRWGVLGFDSDPNYIIPEIAVASTGSVYLFGRGSVQTDVHLVRLGGWSSSESGTSEPDYRTAGIERIGYGYYDGTSTGFYCGLFVPNGLPTAQGWTDLDTDGTISTTTAGTPALVITTAAAEARTFFRNADAEHVTGSGEVHLQYISQGGVTPIPFVQVELTDGVYSYRSIIFIDQSKIDVYDDGVGLIATLNIDTIDGIHIRWHATLGTVSVLARIPGETAWQEVCRDEAVVDNTGPVAAVDRVTWGHAAVGAGSDVSHWFFVGATAGGSFLYGLDGPSEGYASPTDGIRGLQYGGPLVSDSMGGYPIPDATPSDGGSLGRMGASGLTYVSETVELPVSYLHSVRHLHPLESPSPYETWEQTADAAAVFCYDAENAAWHGGALAVVALHATIRTVALTSGNNPDGTTGWVTHGTLDLSLGNLNYALNGDTITPDTGTAVIARLIYEGELRGGWVDLGGAGATRVYRRIAGNSQGYWTTSSSVQRIRIWLEGIDGTEDASGTGNLYHHSGVMVVYPTSDPVRRFLRLTLSTIATDDDAVQSAGMLGIARVVGVGSIPGWAWIRRTDDHKTISRAADGSPTVREDGPPLETWTYEFTPPQLWQNHRLASMAPDIVANSTAQVPIGTIHDAWTLQHLIEHAARSGERPMIVLPRLPTTTGTTITDPTMYLVGFAVAESSALTGMGGTEGTDEGVRYDGITVEAVGGRNPRRTS